MKLTRKISSQQTNLVREHPAYLSLNLKAQEACGLLQSVTLCKMKHKMKINIAAKVFHRSIIIYFKRYKNVLDVFLKTRRDSELEKKDIDKAKNVGLRVYDQGVVTYKQNKLGLSAYYDTRYVLADGIHTRPLDF